MRVLDLSSGYRGIWFNKNPKDVLFVDVDSQVGPDVVADSRMLPFNGPFDLIVFDPPHTNVGKKSNMARDYGYHTTEAIIDIIRKTAREAHRVTSASALMAFKWNDHDQSFDKVLAMMAAWWEPLFGTTTARRTKHPCSTQWIMLRRVT